jgi:hypothetical protein
LIDSTTSEVVSALWLSWTDSLMGLT